MCDRVTLAKADTGADPGGEVCQLPSGFCLTQLSIGLVPAQAVHLTLQPPKLNEGSGGGGKGLGHQTAVLLL